MIFTVTKILLNIKTYEDVAGVGDGSDDSGGNHELLPGLSEVDDVETISTTLPDVRTLSNRRVRLIPIYLIIFYT